MNRLNQVVNTLQGQHAALALQQTQNMMRESAVCCRASFKGGGGSGGSSPSFLRDIDQPEPESPNGFLSSEESEQETEFECLSEFLCVWTDGNKTNNL